MANSLPNIDELTIWYKYTATMTFVKRSYSHFKQSIMEKAINFLRGKAEIHVVPFYFHSTGIYYQPIFDFDKCNSKYEPLSFLESVLLTNGNHKRDFFIELSPHGIHVGCKYAFGPIDVDDVKLIRNYARKHFESKFPHLDVISSIRFMAISRTPSFLKGKRMFAIEVYQYERKNLKDLRRLQDRLTKISFDFFSLQVKNYLFLKGLKPITEAPDYVLNALKNQSLWKDAGTGTELVPVPSTVSNNQ